MKDLSFAEVAPRYDEWCRTDITDAELIDNLIEGSKDLAAQLEEAQHVGDLRLTVIHAQSRQLAAMGGKVREAQRQIAALRHDLETARIIMVIVVLAACACWLRLGVGR